VVDLLCISVEITPIRSAPYKAYVLAFENIKLFRGSIRALRYRENSKRFLNLPKEAVPQISISCILFLDGENKGENLVKLSF
jgi:hypothetical protein